MGLGLRFGDGVEVAPGGNAALQCNGLQALSPQCLRRTGAGSLVVSGTVGDDEFSLVGRFSNLLAGMRPVEGLIWQYPLTAGNL